jgi:hypothetical protein
VRQRWRRRGDQCDAPHCDRLAGEAVPGVAQNDSLDRPFAVISGHTERVARDMASCVKAEGDVVPVIVGILIG